MSKKHTIVFEVRADGIFNHVWNLEQVIEGERVGIASRSGPADETVYLEAGEYVETVTGRGHNANTFTTEQRITVTDGGRVIRHPVPGSLPLSELI